MKRLIEQRQIGTPTSMVMSEIYLMLEDLVRRYHEPLTEVLCHQEYLILAFLGEPKRVQAFTSCYRHSFFPKKDEQVTRQRVELINVSTAHLFVSWTGYDETSILGLLRLKY
jgi:predicted dehydrogenase